MAEENPNKANSPHGGKLKSYYEGCYQVDHGMLRLKQSGDV